MNRIVQTDSDFHRVPVFTTREARPDDEPGMFRVHPHDDEAVSRILDQIDNRELVQYAVHPTSGRIYGTAIADHPGKFNLLATLSGAVDQLRSLPFKRTHVIGLSTHPDNWKKWLLGRYPEQSEERTKRIKEARSSLEWLLAPERQSMVSWVDNPADDPEAAVRSVIGIVKYNEQGSLAAQEHARQILRFTEELQ